VKSPEKLLDIYFHSAGRNSVLLMNIPPDKDGLINEADMKVLKEWKKLRTDIFKNNLAKDAIVISANGINAKAILDDNYITYWTTKEKDTAAVIELKLKGSKTFNVLSLQENINVGQRIEQFEMDYWNGNSWQRAAEGTTVGYKRLIQFDPISTEKVRLKIISSRINPTIAELGLYQQNK
jgi:alpha-L-fucosidase